MVLKFKPGSLKVIPIGLNSLNWMVLNFKPDGLESLNRMVLNLNTRWSSKFKNRMVLKIKPDGLQV